MATRMLQRRGTAAEWAAQNPVLSNGEIGFETDTKILKLGDGITAWNDLSLPYVMSAGGVMTGPLTIVEPTDPNHAARLSEVTDAVDHIDTSIVEVYSDLAQVSIREILTFEENDEFVKGVYPWLKFVRARVQAGGGAGARAPETASNASAGDGGGGGGYAESLISVGDLLSSENIIVGLGGIAADGGSSSFGAHAAASGGALGAVLSPTTFAAFNTHNNLGGVGTVGDILLSGGRGLNSAAMSANRSLGGTGGDSIMGHGGIGRGSGGSSSPGGNGRGRGGGGGGSANSQSQSETLGGVGAKGVVILELYG